MATSTNLFEQIALDLQVHGVSIQSLDLQEPALLALSERLDILSQQDFHKAGIGRQEDHMKNEQVRRDKIHWLETSDPNEALFLTYMQDLKVYLNRRLFLGLFSYECHFAHYEPGAFYKKHLDAFKGEANRILSTVLYLNPDWQEGDGGELAIYDPNDSEQVLLIVPPSYGTLVTFLSDEFPHEVLPAKKARYSIAGWFRVNTSVAGNIDPPQ
ncbi:MULTISPECIES: 2OG-Fe(II) oxygenase [Pseudoalteromonas]|uniref:Proline hydroxylase n=1 Tax=Pseudoalteromonas amylolytica TaxID=1859457 RepID=A0A1S1MKN6_9GAMM|nr:MULTISPECIES: 2OG-Fe(II) oxygenase [Pseudoalteromonas]OHU84421.1 proline hydroxylase [Pseudoalteromonas sp. JW3]OHU87240.1 proline hydroxylase [Pseudoalteromonas amylolytica]